MFVSLLLMTAQEAAEPAPVVPAKVEETVLYTLPAEYSEERASSFVSPDGKRFVVHIAGDDGTTVILDGEIVGRHAYVNGPAWGEDTVAWSWGDPSGRRTEEWKLWQDGKETAKADWMGPVGLDGDTPVYWSADGLKIGGDGSYTGGDYQVRRGKKANKDKYKDAGMFGPPLPLPKGKLAYIGRAGKGYLVIFGKEEFGNYLWANGLVVSADGKRAAWSGFGDRSLSTKRDPLAGLGNGGGFGLSLIFTTGSKADGKKEPAAHGADYASLAAPALGGPDGAQLGYLARRSSDEGILVVKDGMELPGNWGAVGTPIFSPDGSKLAYTVDATASSAGSGRGAIDTGKMDGFRYGPMPQLGRDLFGGGSARGAGGTELPGGAGDEAKESASAGGDSCYLVVDGEIQTAGHGLAYLPIWSPDSQRVACRVRTADGEAVVCGDAQSPAFDEVGAPRFLDATRIGFGARKGREIRWVELSLAD